MRFLLDTCIVSELIKKNPNDDLVKWFADQNELDMYISVITVGELKKGIEKLTTSQRKKRLEKWLYQELLPSFQERILPINQAVMESWGEINGLAERSGKKIPVFDGLLAATAYTYQLVVVTRNVKDFKYTKVPCESPWEN